jgi:hypothetical protein
VLDSERRDPSGDRCRADGGSLRTRTLAFRSAVPFIDDGSRCLRVSGHNGSHDDGAANWDDGTRRGGTSNNEG